MKRLLSLFLISLTLVARSQEIKSLPDSVYSGKQGKFHAQGLAVDQVRGFVYFSFTNKLVKTDLNGKLIGSVRGFVGHLGDLDLNTANGRVYGSLEYKDDAIGKGISKTLGVQRREQNGFYVAIFDVDRIVRPDMDAEKDNLLRTVYIREAVKDYEATVQSGDGTKPHRFACSGIDGLAIAPAIGSTDTSKKYLYVAYGVYGDVDRMDNDHQVILKYDISKWDTYGQRLSQGKLHQSGPQKPMGKYFVKTGSTRYGIQNLAYDAHTQKLFAAVYRGSKPKFPNYDLFVIDVLQQPVKSEISSGDQKIKVETLDSFKGWDFKWGSTGLCPLGGGMFYISHNKKDKDGQEETTVHQYKWVGDADHSFVPVN